MSNDTTQAPPSPQPAVGGPGCNDQLGPLSTIPTGETDAEFTAQIEAEHCRPLAPPERMPQYIRDELPDELAAHRLQAWADARVAAERERAHNAGFVEASRMHGTEIERLRSVLVECQAHLACNAVTENLVALYGRVRAALGPNVRANRPSGAAQE